MEHAMALPVYERQREKMEMLGRFSAGIVHDFNSILYAIVGYADLLVMRTSHGSAERRYAENVLTAAQRASALVDQILSYGRGDRAKRCVVDLRDAAAEALELFRGKLPGGIALESSIASAPVRVLADATQLHQVVMNLCTNAAHAIGERGTIRVALDATEDGSAVLKVTDSGCGMDAETAARIFEPFFTTKETGKGTGLGLALVQAIVSDLGGSIDVATQVGRGTTFTIALPLAGPRLVTMPN